jgi:hypothetical protein
MAKLEARDKIRVITERKLKFIHRYNLLSDVIKMAKTYPVCNLDRYVEWKNEMKIEIDKCEEECEAVRKEYIMQSECPCH